MGILRRIGMRISKEGMSQAFIVRDNLRGATTVKAVIRITLEETIKGI